MKPAILTNIGATTLVVAASFFVPRFARSAPAPAAEAAILELASISVDEAPTTDLAAYEGFEVAIQARGTEAIVERVIATQESTGDWIYYEKAQ